MLLRLLFDFIKRVRSSLNVVWRLGFGFNVVRKRLKVLINVS